MPITHRGYKVHIESDGKELPQFQVEVVDERTVKCWIPSEAGKAFSMQYDTLGPHPFEYMRAKLYADGRQLCTHGGNNVGEKDRLAHSNISLDSETQEKHGRPLLFSEVVLAPEGDGTETSNAPSPEQIGVIEVHFQAAERIPRKPQGSRPSRKESYENTLKLSEMSKLIGTNHVRLGATEKIPTQPRRKYSYQSLPGDSYAVFLFHHRPASVLQAMGIMPRPPRPQTPPCTITTSSHMAHLSQAEKEGRVNGKRPRIDSEGEDVKPIINSGQDIQPTSNRDSLAAKRRRMQAEIAAEEAEADARQARAALLRAQLEEAEAVESQTRGASVKPERAPSPISVPRSGEVIDLTDL